MSAPGATSVPSASNERPAGGRRLRTVVYDTLKDGIISGRYQPSEWLSVESLSESLGVSRQPVMDALRILSAEWMVEIVPQVGSRVAAYDEQAILDFLRNVGVLQGRVVALAAERRTDEQMQRLRALATSVATAETFEFRDTDMFHRVILEAAHSALLEKICGQTWRFGNYVWSILIPHRYDERARDLHRRELIVHVADAIEIQDGELAQLYATAWLLGPLAMRIDG